jgi:hypothetical protein
MKEVELPSISERMKDTELLLNAMDKAVHDALRVHKLLGQSIVVWEEGKVKIIPPDQIPLNGDTSGNGAAASH